MSELIKKLIFAKLSDKAQLTQINAKNRGCARLEQAADPNEGAIAP